jgi:Flp pilus assembly protein TadG
MKRSGMWAAGVVLVLLVVGAGVLAGGAGYAEDNGDENAVAKCSKATLHGTYLFAHDGVVTGGPDKGPFAIAGMETYDGNGKVKGVYTSNFNGNVARHQSFDATYTVKADCTGTVTSGPDAQDVFIAPDGSMFTFVQTKSPETVTSGFELQGTAKRVGD